MSDLVSENLNMIFKTPKGETVHALKDLNLWTHLSMTEWSGIKIFVPVSNISSRINEAWKISESFWNLEIVSQNIENIKRDVLCQLLVMKIIENQYFLDLSYGICRLFFLNYLSFFLDNI